MVGIAFEADFGDDNGAGGPAGPNTPGLWDQLRRGWADWPAVLWEWAKGNLDRRTLMRSWSMVLARPADDAAPVGIQVSWGALGLEWLLVGLVVTSFCAIFLKFGKRGRGGRAQNRAGGR